MKMEQRKPKKIKTVEVFCPVTNWPLEVHVEARTDISEAILPGASIPPEPLGDGKWLLKWWCCYCDEIHDFIVELEEEPAPTEQPEKKHGADIVQVPAERDASRINVEPVLHRLFVDSPNVKTSFQGLERLRKSYLPTPADGAAAYHEGVRKARTDEPREMEKALILLKRAKEIYEENERPVAAAYVAVVMAEIRMKRGEPEKAKEELEFAESRLGEEDVHAKRRAAEVREWLEGEK